MILHCSFRECRRPVIVIRQSLACQLTAMMNPHLVCTHIVAVVDVAVMEVVVMDVP